MSLLLLLTTLLSNIPTCVPDDGPLLIISFDPFYLFPFFPSSCLYKSVCGEIWRRRGGLTLNLIHLSFNLFMFFFV
jgi:hypothetical protein